MDKFDEMLQKEASLGYVYRLAKESERMLKATLEIDTSTMEEILEYAHNTETPILSYNNEVELSLCERQLPGGERGQGRTWICGLYFLS